MQCKIALDGHCSLVLYTVRVPLSWQRAEIMYYPSSSEPPPCARQKQRDCAAGVGVCRGD